MLIGCGFLVDPRRQHVVRVSCGGRPVGTVGPVVGGGAGGDGGRAVGTVV